MVEVRWVGWALDSTEKCRVDESREGVRIESVIETVFGTCTYGVIADRSWQFRSLTMRLGPRSLRADYGGAAWVVNDIVRPDLDVAREVDIAISPLSNSLPIRRLGLAIGESAEITTAYVSVPHLTVATDPQRYTRLAEREYRYESRDSDFVATLAVDAHGLVIDYPGLFVRSDH
ncbi:putative glycolipid-binding domain-containing protein [Agromyces italicus]|uniref:putative glycolipid-binding domain-containing protein n=1 Tax=Agromyces italicus TaxID=279572 RepID=UPI0004206C6F|nr:putative glycolipid-binding domain-containing protein [Agromyces italicus]